jgi:multicomponent Na+:H+ antiporter subunit D
MGDIRILLPSLYANRAVQTAFVFFLVGLGIKMAFFPLHTWQPDSYTHAPSAVSVIIATAMAKVSIYALIRVIFSVFTVDFIRTYMPLCTIISWLAAIAIIIGSILAIAQYTLKRMLAYSSVSQVGYIVLGITLFYTYWGLPGALMHLLNHAITKGCLFMAACGFIYKAKLWDIRDFAGLGRKMPWTCAAFLIAAISMIGVPPSVGFVTKLYLILASLEAKQFVFVAVMLLSTLLNLVYFWRVIETMYMRRGKEEESEQGHGKGEVPLSMLIPALILASLCFIIGILWLTGIPMPIINQAISSMGVVRP